MLKAEEILSELIKFKSITPDDAGCLAYITELLRPLGFDFFHVPQGGVQNLYAVKGTGVNFCFAGHVDVVPPGNNWSMDPFTPTVLDGKIFGRGVTDMKGAIAAWIAALYQSPLSKGRWSMLLTSDEEGVAIDGTKAVIAWLKEQKEKIDYCLVGEPTNPNTVGEMIKVGRRGSLNLSMEFKDFGGHVAYSSANPIHRLLEGLSPLIDHCLDNGNELFDPSILQITAIDAPNEVRNLLLQEAKAYINIRYNPLHNAESLLEILRKYAHKAIIEVQSDNQPFYCQNNSLIDLLQNAIKKITGKKAFLSTSGGTSDARFLHHICPVLEFGLCSNTAHIKDEWINLSDLNTLTDIYRCVIDQISASNLLV